MKTLLNKHFFFVYFLNRIFQLTFKDELKTIQRKLFLCVYFNLYLD